jgi:hypothetical protein
MREREVFMKWQDFFVGHYRTGQNGLPTSPFDTQYYSEGIGEIEIVQFSYPIPPVGKGKSAQKQSDYVESYSIMLHEAYPINVNDIQMAWSDDGYAKMQVEIQYRYATELQKTFTSDREFQTSKMNRGR